ncbi:MAG: glycosyltransferase family A protein [Smithella sp.]
MIKCSVVIPLFNKASQISRAISSILGQTVQAFEIIVVDDGSSDGGGEIAQGFGDPRIRIVRQDNAGVSAARNRGIQLASQELIAFLDADDEWHPCFLETIMRLAAEHPDAGAYATNYEIITHTGSRLPRLKALPPFPWEGIIPRYFLSAALGEPPTTASSLCIPKHVLKQTGGFAMGKRMGEDLDLWGRIALQYPIAFSSIVGASYHHDVENRASMTFNQRDEHPFCTTVVDLLQTEGIPPNVADDVDLYVLRLKVENMRQHVLAGNFQRALEMNDDVNKKRFCFRRLLWGSRLNVLTRIVWHFWHWRTR